MPDPRKCEALEFMNGVRCTSLSRWVVRVGTRNADAQECCGTHLNQTCIAMLGAEGRDAALTVTEVAR